MRIVVANDHAGFNLKRVVLTILAKTDNKVIDLGSYDEKSVDYPDYAEKLCGLIQSGEADRGVLICGSGIGASIAANKFRGIYAGVCHDTYSAHQGVEHDNMNVLCLGGRVIGEELASEIVKTFIKAKYIGDERHARRVNKIRDIEARCK